MPDLQLPAPGDLLRRKYRVERLLGSGGTGAVFAAYHEVVQRNVAIELLLPHGIPAGMEVAIDQVALALDAGEPACPWTPATTR